MCMFLTDRHVPLGAAKRVDGYCLPPGSRSGGCAEGRSDRARGRESGKGVKTGALLIEEPYCHAITKGNSRVRRRPALVSNPCFVLFHVQLSTQNYS